MAVEQPRQPPRLDRWNAVRRWLGLRGESKLAWLYLWALAGGRPGIVTVHTGSVAEDQGTSDRAGRRYLEALADHGLIRVRERVEGRWTIEVRDPLEVAKARLSSLGNDGQGELFLPADGSEEAAAEELQSQGEANPPAAGTDVLRPPVFFANPAADVTPHPPSAIQDTEYPLEKESIGIPDTNTRRAQNQSIGIGGGGSDARSAAAGNLSTARPRSRPAEEWARQQLVRRAAWQAKETPEPTTAGDVVGAILRRLPTPEEQRQQAERLAAVLAKEVADPSTLPSTWQRIAWAVVEGLVPRAKVQLCLRSFRQAAAAKKFPPGQGGGYFMAAIKEQFKKCGVDWRGQA